MEFRVSDKMAEFINKVMNRKEKKCEAKVVSIPFDLFPLFTGNPIFNAEEDYDEETDEVKVIKVEYTDEYAEKHPLLGLPKYLTTFDLQYEYKKRCDGCGWSKQELIRFILDI